MGCKVETTHRLHIHNSSRGGGRIVDLVHAIDLESLGKPRFPQDKRFALVWLGTAELLIDSFCTLSCLQPILVSGEHGKHSRDHLAGQSLAWRVGCRDDLGSSLIECLDIGHGCFISDHTICSMTLVNDENDRTRKLS